MTRQRLASLGLGVNVDSIYLLPLSRSDTTAGRMATLADPTAPADVALDMLSLATVTERLDAWAAVELCKLSGLLPAAVLVPGEKIEAKVATVSLAAVSAYRRLSAATLRPVSEARVPMADAEDVRIVSFRPPTVARTSTPFLWVRRSVRRLRWPAFIRSALPAIFWDHCAATAATSCAAQFAGWRMKAVVSCCISRRRGAASA